MGQGAGGKRPKAEGKRQKTGGRRQGVGGKRHEAGVRGRGPRASSVGVSE